MNWKVSKVIKCITYLIQQTDLWVWIFLCVIAITRCCKITIHMAFTDFLFCWFWLSTCLSYDSFALFQFWEKLHIVVEMHHLLDKRTRKEEKLESYSGVTTHIIVQLIVPYVKRRKRDLFIYIKNICKLSKIKP